MKKYDTLATSFNVKKALAITEEGYSAENTRKLKDMCDVYNIAEGCLDVFAHITPVKNSTGKYSVLETMKNLVSDDKLVTKYDQYIPSSFVRDLVVFIGTANPGQILGKKSITKCPSMGAFTPKFLYAFKRNKDIQYEEWDKQDLGMPLALGKRLQSIHYLADAFTREDYEKYILPNIEKLRDAGLGEKPVVSHVLKLDAIDVLTNNILADNQTLAATIKNNKTMFNFCMQIMLQTWTANAQYRVPDTMILDMWDWDRTPKALDVEVKDIEIFGKKVVDIKDLPF